MKALKYSISLALVAGFALTASCGGSNTQSDSSAGASNGGESALAGGSNPTAGASSAGAHATAGASAGGDTGVAGDMNSDGGVMDEPGGGPSIGGMSSTAGAGGGTMLPAGCPAAAPMDATACSSPASQNTRCNYSGSSCRCRDTQVGGDAGAGNNTREWQCHDTLVCPAAAPMTGAKCGALTGQCAYTGANCTCGFNGNWACQNTLVCPAAKPTVGDMCVPAKGACQYAGMSACTCGQNSKWQCFGGGGNNADCPATKPVTGGACTGNTACPYGNAGCICLQDKWACN